MVATRYSLRGLFCETFLKQIARSFRTLLSQPDRSCFGCGIRDETLVMETIQGIPIVAFPCPPVGLVLKCRQIQQSQYRLVDLFFIDLHEITPVPKGCQEPQNNMIRDVSDPITKLTAKAPHMV
jgi:hypothetical protein